ncbi:hypothetical protein [Oxobacter pfennigii]|uniref:hypothetical protein n=1 Tax=Oxobacter pfennigii TaxID=36849 RepID=UPI001364AB72|nr:hypothetical protein [Oxobacter pfennigii]
MSAYFVRKFKLNETHEDNYPYEYAPVVGLLVTYPIIGQSLAFVLFIGAPIGFIIGFGNTFNLDYISGFIAISFFEIFLGTLVRTITKKY